MSWYGGALGGEKVAEYVVDWTIPSFSYTNEMLTSFYTAFTIRSPASDHAVVRYRIKTDTYFRKGPSLHDGTCGPTFQVNSGYYAGVWFGLLHNVPTADDAGIYPTYDGEKYTTAADWVSALGSPTRIVHSILGTNVQYDSANADYVTGNGVNNVKVGAFDTAGSNNLNGRSVVFHQDGSGVLDTQNIWGNTAKQTYQHNFMVAASAGVTCRTEVFYS